MQWRQPMTVAGTSLMARITFVEKDGTERSADVATGISVMRGAIEAGVNGIDAICGGQCACATCHCYIDNAWLDRLPAIREIEDEMLDETAAERRVQSRLTCQIIVTAELDGLRVFIP